MNKKNKATFNRSDIEKSLSEEFPSLSKSQISDAINVIINSITEAVALDEKEDLELFQKNLYGQENFQILEQRGSLILVRQLQCILNHQSHY